MLSYKNPDIWSPVSYRQIIICLYILNPAKNFKLTDADQIPDFYYSLYIELLITTSSLLIISDRLGSSYKIIYRLIF